MNNVAEHAREQKAGMKCPQCGAFIAVSYTHLTLPTNREV